MEMYCCVYSTQCMFFDRRLICIFLHHCLLRRLISFKLRAIKEVNDFGETFFGLPLTYREKECPPCVRAKVMTVPA